MLQLRDIMTTDLLTVGPQTSVREAMELLGSRHVSGAPVVSGLTVVGVVSGTDLMAFAAALSGVPTERDPHEEWDQAPETTVEEDVEDEREPSSAFFSEMWDDAGADVTERMSSVSGPEWNVLEEHDVSEVMTRTPLTSLPSTASVEFAASLMKAQGIHRILVIDNERLVGIVSALDVATAAADHKLSARVYAFNHDKDFRSQ